MQRKTRELSSLGNRVRRYWKKLLTEAIRIAKVRRVRSVIVDLENINSEIFISPNEIPLYRDGEAIDADLFLRLAQPKYPSLYRKYVQGKEKYERGLSELERMSSSGI